MNSNQKNNFLPQNLKKINLETIHKSLQEIGPYNQLKTFDVDPIFIQKYCPLVNNVDLCHYHGIEIDVYTNLK
jgi:hypothetical protein